MKLSIRKRNTLRKGKTQNIRNTIRKRNQNKRTRRKLHTGGENTVWTFFDKIKWKYNEDGINKASTKVKLTYTKEGSFFGSEREFDVILTNNVSAFELEMKRLNMNKFGSTYDKTLTLEFKIEENNSVYTLTYSKQTLIFKVSPNGSVYSLNCEQNKFTIINTEEKYIFEIDDKHLSNYAFFLSLSEQIYKIHILHANKDQDIPSFFNMLVVKDNTLLLKVIRSNFKLFIKYFKLKDNITDTNYYRKYDGIKPQLKDDTFESYWRGAQIMECFKNRQFHFDDDITNVFSSYLNSTYDKKEQTCSIKKEGTTNITPFQCTKKLGKGGKIGTPYIVDINNTKIIMKITKDIHLNINVMCSKGNTRKCEECKKLQDGDDKKICFPKTNEIQHIVKSSEYINETIIGYVLNTIFFPNHDKAELNDILNGNLYDGELGNSVYQIGHFQSNDNYGANLMEKADGELDKLFNIFNEKKEIDNKKLIHENEHFSKITLEHNENLYSGSNPAHTNIIIVMLLLQLSNTLKKVADELGMTHGDLKAGNVFFSIKKSYMNVDYPLYEEGISKTSVNVKTNIRLKIADYGKSSIIYDGVRFYCGSYKTRMVPKKYKANDYKLEKLEVEPHTPYYSYNYSKFDILEPSLSDILKPSVRIAHQLRHIKCPYYRSFDLYCVIISLALQCKSFRDFYKFAFEHYEPSLREALFIESTHDQIMGFETLKMDKPESITTVFDILNDKYLKCNAIEDFIDACTKILTKLLSSNATSTPAPN